ncbi:hypothetical protein SAMN04487895_12854 [Paenibacillus sophorae]|uniref:Uncharacterized protein n=1 Tax=Paenibacillus sophorae TaxID=1333845 RepID=A0A1H8VX16_9BACL|nr:hypothetical protein SAMN04487895_12854 [Paenibacillus sophorae]
MTLTTCIITYLHLRSQLLMDFAGEMLNHALNTENTVPMPFRMDSLQCRNERRALPGGGTENLLKGF